jgi:hypothetical protein
MFNSRLTLLLAAVGVAAPAFAQPNLKAVPLPSGDDELTRLRDQLDGPGGPDGPGFDLDWHTIDGGGATYLTGGTFELGATAGQPDAGVMTGGTFVLGGGFWHGVGGGSCYANCDNSTGNPLLTANDFQCFVNAYASNSPYANCDGSAGSPTLTANDFLCFLNAYANGCS